MFPFRVWEFHICKRLSINDDFIEMDGEGILRSQSRYDSRELRRVSYSLSGSRIGHRAEDRFFPIQRRYDLALLDSNEALSSPIKYIQVPLPRRASSDELQLPQVIS